MTNNIINKSVCLILIICMLCPIAAADSHWNLALEDDGQSTEESSDNANQRRPYNRSAGVGFFMALVPGFFMHGLGNMYAGNTGTGFIMLCTEAGSIGVLMLAFAVNTKGNGSGEPFDIKFDGAANVLLCISAGMFFGSWIWDIVTVGDEIQKRQKKRKVQVLFGQLSRIDSRNDPVFGLNLSINF